MTEPHELTENEVREKFLDACWGAVEFWDTRVGPDMSHTERLSGLMHSIMAILDGANAGICAFIVAPDPHPEDRAFSQDQGDDWYPENHEILPQLNADISGPLHELMYQPPNRPHWA